MSNTLFIVNDAPYGSERPYNALRLAGALSTREGEQVRVFLLADAVAAHGPARRCRTVTTTWR